VIKTYLWIVATEYSKINNKKIKMKEGKNIKGLFSLIFLSKLRSKCPAIILAANRTDKVIGRIIFLIVSIITINLESIIGVPIGTKCENIWLYKLIHPYNKNIIQKGSARVNVIRRCLVAVKI